jgi:hypothetical protein
MLLWFRTRAPFASPPRPVGRLLGSYPETGLEEINSDLLEADLWLASLPRSLSELRVLRGTNPRWRYHDLNESCCHVIDEA